MDVSGAGRSTAAKCLEDLGFFVVDNIPPELIATMVELGSRTELLLKATQAFGILCVQSG